MVLVRHASGVEDSFLWPPKNALGGTSLKSNFASLFYSKQRERKREEQRARNKIASKFNNGGFCMQRYDPCVCILRAGKMYFPQIFVEQRERKRREGGKTLEYIFRRVALITRVLYLSLFHSLFVNVCFTTKVYVKCHVRIANRVGEDSYCRGGIVHSRGVCGSALLVRRNRSTALWPFRASTSNSLNGRTWPHTHTQI